MEPQPPPSSPPSGWQPPGEVAAGWPNEPVPPERRPISITAAAIVLIVMGVLVGLLGVLVLLVGVSFATIVSTSEFRDQFGDIDPAAGGAFVVFGIITLADGVGQVVSGSFILARRSWARVSGLIVGVLGVLLTLIGVLPGEAGGTNLFFVLALAAYVYVVWVLATGGRWFRC